MQTKISSCRWEFFLKINKCADQNKALQGEIFLKIDKRVDQNKAVHIGLNRRAGGIFSQNQ